MSLRQQEDIKKSSPISPMPPASIRFARLPWFENGQNGHVKNIINCSCCFVEQFALANTLQYEIHTQSLSKKNCALVAFGVPTWCHLRWPRFLKETNYAVADGQMDGGNCAFDNCFRPWIKLEILLVVTLKITLCDRFVRISCIWTFFRL